MATHLPRKEISYQSLAISLADIQRIFERLLVQVNDQADRELNALIQQPNESDADFQARKTDLRVRVFRITVTIDGTAGSSLFGDDVTVFTSPNRPNQIRSVYMTNVNAYKGVVGVKPLNSFELFLDFSKPALLDPNRFVSSPTLNESNLSVGGDRDAWVAAVAEAVNGVLAGHETRRGWMHKAFIYDAGLLLLGIPFGFYVCLKLSGLAGSLFGTVHPFLAAAFYVYVFFLALWAYRVLFGYTKWAFPTVELTDNRDTAKAHRKVWWAIVLGIVGDALWEGFHLLT